ncbi:hypothetical protein BJV78DRAFT_949628 [Lactifluus subvellereus]|nr:hypothetical protein BJV78DRAFT_949628 [Lactifluus subvellereus]
MPLTTGAATSRLLYHNISLILVGPYGCDLQTSYVRVSQPRASRFSSDPYPHDSERYSTESRKCKWGRRATEQRQKDHRRAMILGLLLEAIDIRSAVRCGRGLEPVQTGVSYGGRENGRPIYSPTALRLAKGITLLPPTVSHSTLRDKPWDWAILLQTIRYLKTSQVLARRLPNRCAMRLPCRGASHALWGMPNLARAILVMNNSYAYRRHTYPSQCRWALHPEISYRHPCICHFHTCTTLVDHYRQFGPSPSSSQEYVVLEPVRRNSRYTRGIQRFTKAAWRKV